MHREGERERTPDSMPELENSSADEDVTDAFGVGNKTSSAQLLDRSLTHTPMQTPDVSIDNIEFTTPFASTRKATADAKTD